MAFWSLNFAQSSSTFPRQEKLLNGLRVLLWSDPSSPKVSVKLRVHAGASFDPQDKEGVMKLLSEAIFPNNDIREFFTDELGGDLLVTCRYDYIEIAASSKADAYLSMLETLANAVTNPVLDRTVTETVKGRIMTIVEADQKNPAFEADAAVRKRLFQSFPYGRTINGTTESLKKVDFADLKFGYDRLFGADNATIAISGNFPSDVGFRAVRRYFGAWLKSDKLVPSTFRQPDPPPAGVQVVSLPGSEMTEIRYAIRGVARNERDYPASLLLARIYEQRIRMKVPDDRKANVFVLNEANILPGVMIFGFTQIRRAMTAEVTSEVPKIEANDAISNALNARITGVEFDAAKAAAIVADDAKDVMARWLDTDTYRLAGVRQDQQAIRSVVISDVQKLSDRLKQQPIASVLLLPSIGGN